MLYLIFDKRCCRTSSIIFISTFQWLITIMGHKVEISGLKSCKYQVWLGLLDAWKKHIVCSSGGWNITLSCFLFRKTENTKSTAFVSKMQEKFERRFKVFAPLLWKTFFFSSYERNKSKIIPLGHFSRYCWTACYTLCFITDLLIMLWYPQ